MADIDDGQNGVTPKSSLMGLVLPQPNNKEDLQLVARNDEHHASMTHDEDFMAQINKRNEEANQLMNLNNDKLTQAGSNAAQGADVLVANTNEDFINKKWRPMMAWLYMTVCAFDFVIFPILWSILQMADHGSVTTPWQPITLQGAGLFHISMGAVLGIATYGRTKEKIEGVNNNSTNTSTPGLPAGLPGIPGK